MNENKIELEIPHKTVYMDIVGMPNPLLLGLTVHYYNHSDNTLYMKINSVSAGSWTGSTVALGSIGSGLDAYINLDNFASRTRPSVATNETLTVTLKGYSDANYTTLVYTFSRDITMIFIKSDDGTWTSDFTDNFDNGTVSGWNASFSPGSGSLAVATDYVLSTVYSLKSSQSGSHSGTDPFEFITDIYKQFIVPNKTTVYAIINVRTSASVSSDYSKNIQVLQDTTVLTLIGRPFDNVAVLAIPKDKWIRIVVPLTPNVTSTMYVKSYKYLILNGSFGDYMWMDDFRIISK